jgi:hypothetical protein
LIAFCPVNSAHVPRKEEKEEIEEEEEVDDEGEI